MKSFKIKFFKLIIILFNYYIETTKTTFYFI